MNGDYVEHDAVTPAMKKRWTERKALLRVAVAAGEYTNISWWDVWGKYYSFTRLELALKELEHLL